MKKIIITWDYSSVFNMSFIGVKHLMKADCDEIHTTCLNFFSFDILDAGYEVIVRSERNGTIVLSELLTNPSKYGTEKEIRKEHNACKMLIAGMFNFYKEDNKNAL